MCDKPHDVDTKLLILCPKRKTCNLKTTVCDVWRIYQSAVIAQGFCPKFPKPHPQNTADRFQNAELSDVHCAIRSEISRALMLLNENVPQVDSVRRHLDAARGRLHLLLRTPNKKAGQNPEKEKPV